MRTSIVSKLIVSAALVAVAQTATAADLPMKAPVYTPAAPAPTWTGFYIGLHAGTGWGDVESGLQIGPFGPIPAITFPLASHGVSGFLGGAQAGYNWQTGRVVLGLEGNVSWAGIDGSAPCLFVFTCRTEINWMGDVSARFGVTAGDALIYVKGGYAWANADYSGTLGIPIIPVTATGSATRSGLLFGTGVEYLFAANWSAKIEYNYIDFGNDNVPLTITPPIGIAIPISANIDQKLHTIKFGVNFHM